MRLFYVVLVLLCSLCASVATAADVERWFEMQLLGQPAGWSNELQREQGDGEAYWSTETSMHIKRGSVEVSLSMQVAWLEASDGTPISMTMRQDMSGQRMGVIWAFDGDTIEVTGSQDGRRTTSKVKVPEGTWYSAGALKQETARRITSGETEFALKTMLPDIGVKLVTVTSKQTGTGMYEHDGQSVPVTIWKVTNDAMPFVSNVKMDAQGQIMETVMEAPFGEMVMRRTTKAKAVASFEGSDGPELMDSLMVPVSRPIPNWRTDRTASFRLKARTGAIPSLPSTGYQRMGAVADDGTAVLRVDLDSPSIASEADRTNADFLGASTMIDPTDPAIVKLKDRALDGIGSGEAERAEALRHFTYEWISRKNYATVYASASETARTRTGDCSEHGVLLAALLRADGIPSRAASGAVYLPPGAVAEGPVFGWHMWTQAIIDGHWVDLDATLPVPYTVGHLLADTTAMTDSGGLSNQWNLLSLIGNLTVDVLSVDGSPDS
ncbi:MAG: transglutaminase-like domain-containing protein [Phycisphaerales bacterium]|nr:transglutaminase-like domain-containing protein [Phycisphaerales bacterium]